MPNIRVYVVTVFSSILLTLIIDEYKTMIYICTIQNLGDVNQIDVTNVNQHDINNRSSTLQIKNRTKKLCSLYSFHNSQLLIINSELIALNY